MSISSALTSALSGLTVTARMADVTASNVSNALTEGYARREVQLGARVVGAVGIGVTVTGIARQIDARVLQDLRLAMANQAGRSLGAEVLARLEQALGTPDQAGSLSSRIATLERSLTEAAARPEAEARLASVADAAQSLALGLNALSDEVRQERQWVDGRIATEVTRLNEALAGVADLNLRIRSFSATGQEVSALLDQRQKLIDGIAAVVPVREVARDFGQVALFTTGGTTLLDGRAARFGFTPTAQITPDLSVAGGGLSGLTVNGQPVTTDPEGGRLGIGRLSSLFAVRDSLLPEAQANLDAIARDLIDRVSAPGVDPTRAASAPGLFTDRGTPFDPAAEVGLAGRVSVNTAILPEAGGALWRLRDGLGAATPGPAGFADRLVALGDALRAARPQASGTLAPGARSLSGFTADIASAQSVARQSAEASTAFATARSDTLRSALLEDGVDTDQEMQTLLLIEQSYAANAKVVQTVDEMIQLLLGL